MFKLPYVTCLKEQSLVIHNRHTFDFWYLPTYIIELHVARSWYSLPVGVSSFVRTTKSHLVSFSHTYYWEHSLHTILYFFWIEIHSSNIPVFICTSMPGLIEQKYIPKFPKKSLPQRRVASTLVIATGSRQNLGFGRVRSSQGTTPWCLGSSLPLG